MSGRLLGAQVAAGLFVYARVQMLNYNEPVSAFAWFSFGMAAMALSFAAPRLDHPAT